MYKRILIIKPSSLGDIVMALPALAVLRAEFPSARISWLVKPEFAPFLKCTTGIDNIILFDRKLLANFWCSPAAFCELKNLISRLRAEKFDLVIDLQGLLRTALFGWLTGSAKRFGMKSAREFACAFYTNKIPRAESAHVIDQYLNVIKAVGASVTGPQFNLVVPRQSCAYAQELLSRHNIRPHQYAVFIISSAHICKCWPVEKFAALAEKVTSSFKLPIVAVGTKSEKDTIKSLQRISSVPIFDFSGLTDIPQLVAVLNFAGLVVTNDTGPGHIAAALNVPVVMIFGPTNPARVGPYQRPDSIAAVDPFNRGLAIGSSNPAHNIQAVTIEQVFDKTQTVFQTSRGQ